MKTENKMKNNLTDLEKIEMVWEYIQSLDFEEEVTMDRHDEGYEIQITISEDEENE